MKAARPVFTRLHVLVAVSLEAASIPLLTELIRDGVVVHEGVRGAGATWRTSALLALETDGPWYRRMRDQWLSKVARSGFSDG